MLTLGACKLIVATPLALYPGDGATSVDFVRVPLKADHYYEVRTEAAFLQSRSDQNALGPTAWTYALKIEPADYPLANWNSSEQWGFHVPDQADRPVGIIGVRREIDWVYDYDLAAVAIPAQSAPPLYGLRVDDQLGDGEQRLWHHRGRVSFLTSRVYGDAVLVLNLTRTVPASYVFQTWYPSVRVTECPYTVAAQVFADGFEVG